MTRLSLDLVAETNSLDPHDPKPMTKRDSIVTMNTLANLRAAPVWPQRKKQEPHAAERQTASLTYVVCVQLDSFPICMSIFGVNGSISLVQAG